MRKTIGLLWLCGWSAMALAGGGHSVALKTPHIDLRNKASLQSGAKFFMNYCAGCHSLGYMRYSKMAKDLGIVDATGRVNKTLVQENLIFTGAKIGDLIKVAQPKKDAANWFGIAPPDLTLVARVRGEKWLKTFLTGFYQDPARPFGANNVVFPDVAMPNVLEDLQGEQIAIKRSEKVPYNGQTKTVQVIEHLQLISHGRMTEQQFDHAVDNLVTFLVYAGEPMKLERIHLGIFVLLFLLVFLVVAYLLKKEYWRDVY